MAAKIAGVFEQNLQNKVNNCKVLVVGAGGIGCEVLKNLVMSGFADIEIIDLDTIDVSNLNRQFLFHKEHVGKSKAEVARESALAFNPNVNIKAYHDSITTTSYGVSFFQRFKIVLNALDNRQARNHVNRMCLTADVPLIESGTAGYDGQVELIKKGVTQCYECTPKAAQKSYPGCTIRNTPSEPIHCIVWAKHLFNQLFGEHNEDEDVSPDTADPEAAASAGDAALSSEANQEGNVTRVSTRKWAQDTNYDPEKIFNKLFGDDIKYLLSMSDLWKTRTPPNPLKYGDFANDAESATERNGSGSLPDQKVWNLRECTNVFAVALNELQKEYSSLAIDDHLVWDKDDKYAMDFVAACANVRAHIFHIGLKSRFEVKSMAGNIIPAIATTNAITAGIVVMRALKVLEDQFERCQSVYVRLRVNGRNQILVPDKTIVPPNPKCIVCSPKPEVTIKIDTTRITVKQFRDEVLVKALNMIEPDVTIDSKGVILISSEEGETDCNNDKTLADMQVVDGCILKVDDFFQNYELSVIIAHKEPDREGALFDIVADPEILKKSSDSPAAEVAVEVAAEASAKIAAVVPASTSDDQNGHSPAKKPRLAESTESTESNDDVTIVEEENAAVPSGSKPQPNVNDSDDDICIIEDDDVVLVDASDTKKRKTEETLGEPSSKRAKIVPPPSSDDDLILIEDD